MVYVRRAPQHKVGLGGIFIYYACIYVHTHTYNIIISYTYIVYLLIRRRVSPESYCGAAIHGRNGTLVRPTIYYDIYTAFTTTVVAFGRHIGYNIVDRLIYDGCKMNSMSACVCVGDDEILQ